MPQTTAVVIKTGKGMIEHNLPKQLTPFIGREQAITDIETRLQEVDCHLLTILGLGGVGKTRLAIAVGESQLPNFPDGVWLVRLQSVTSSDWIASTIAESLHLVPGSDEPRQMLLNYLSNKEMLLLLDNYEHLLDETGLSLLSDVIRAAPYLKLVVTSREALNIQEEWRYSVSGLSFPSSETHERNELNLHEATRLFTICARKTKPDLDLGEEFANIVEICRLVDGLPLAIEMAASWLSSLSFDETVSRIERGRLDTRLRNVPDRHRSMSAVFEQSWKLLQEDEREVYTKLSVFADGFQINAAEAVVDANPEILASLVDKSLLQLDSTGRYGIHELARQFGAEKLAENQQQEATVLDAHCDYYTAFLNERKQSFRAQDSSVVMTEIGEEIDNIRLAWDRAIESKRLEIIRETIWCLAEFYEIQNWYREGDYVLGKAIDALRVNDLSEDSGIALGLALVGRGNLLHYLGQMDDAKLLIRDGVSILKQLDAFMETAHALSLLGRLAWMTGDFEIAKQAYRDSVALAEETNDLVTLGFGYLNLSMIAVIEGNFQQSSQLKQTGLTIFQHINHQLGIGIILCIKGEELYLLGHYQQAKDYVLRASEVFIELDNRWHLSNCYENLGHIMFALGDYSEALHHLGMAMSLAQETNDPRRITYCQVNLGDVLHACERTEEANQNYSEGLVLARKAHQRLQEAWSLRGLGFIAYNGVNYELAREYSSASLNISRETGWKIGVVKALNLSGLIASQMGEMDHARAYFLEALDIAILVNADPIILETLICIAGLLVALNDRRSAVRILSECGQHVAIHAALKNRSDHLLHEMSDHLPPDVFVRPKDRSQLPDTNALAAKWRHQLQYIVPSDDDEPLLEQLTRTERRILILMDSELSYPEIAELQHVSINTIKTHRKNIYTKLGVNTREEAVERAKNLRLL